MYCNFIYRILLSETSFTLIGLTLKMQVGGQNLEEKFWYFFFILMRWQLYEQIETSLISNICSTQQSFIYQHLINFNKPNFHI